MNRFNKHLASADAVAGLLGLALMLGGVSGVRGDELTVLRAQEGESGPTGMMSRYLNGLARAALDRRADEVEKLETAEQVAAYRKRMRSFFVRQLGGFPERTPLNARVVEKRAFDDYRMEKVIFESRPGMYVTGVLYLPNADPPYPAVLVPCGHSLLAKAYESYQRASILLAKNGLASFCFDPIGQGERRQILDADGKGTIGSTLEHTLVGTGSILLGTNAARYFIWDGMRAIDYLTSREEVDPDRIGCTGNSGGGTQTSYLMALDERIVAAAPCCFLTSLRRLIPGLGPQDAEQNIYAAIEFGMEHADYILMRAPAPTLMCTATRDFFDIAGSWETFREAKRIYTRLGHAERMDLVETDEQHGFSKWLRVGVTRWMRRWLLHVDDAITEPEFPVLSEDELRCSPRGQVLLMEGAKSVFELNAELEVKLAEDRRKLWSEVPKPVALAKVRAIAGIQKLADLPEPKIEQAGSVQRSGYRIEKLVLRPEPGIALPGLLFAPTRHVGEACLYLHGESKATDAGVGGPIEKLVEAGQLVLAVDLRGIGETEGQTSYKGWKPYFGSDWQDFYRAYLLGRSYVGMRAEDALVCARFLAGYQASGEPNRVHLIAIGEAAVPALHAAALEPAVFTSVQLERCIRSWSDVVRTPVTRNQLINTVHGALRTYDLPDLVATLPPGKLTIANIVDPAR